MSTCSVDKHPQAGDTQATSQLRLHLPFTRRTALRARRRTFLIKFNVIMPRRIRSTVNRRRTRFRTRVIPNYFHLPINRLQASSRVTRRALQQFLIITQENRFIRQRARRVNQTKFVRPTRIRINRNNNIRRSRQRLNTNVST